MGDVLYFESGTSLEDRFKLVCSKIEYYFQKIQNYDSVLNEFSILKNSLEKIVKESEMSALLSKSNQRSYEIQKDALHQLNQRVTDEANRQDSQQASAEISIKELRNYASIAAIDQSLKTEYLRRDVLESLKLYATNEEMALKISEINKCLNDVKFLISSLEANYSKLFDQISNSNALIQSIETVQEKQYKEICILQNAIVRLRAEVIK